jgi:hypothetical protein
MERRTKLGDIISTEKVICNNGTFTEHITLRWGKMHPLFPQAQKCPATTALPGNLNGPTGLYGVILTP